MKNRKKKEQASPYKQSHGHYHSKTQALLEKEKLGKKYPDNAFQVVYERRRKGWRKRWCLCEFVKPKKEVTKKHRLSLPSA